jgi:hypothetical protein
MPTKTKLNLKPGFFTEKTPFECEKPAENFADSSRISTAKFAVVG